MTIDLIWQSETPELAPEWPWGDVHAAAREPSSVAQAVATLTLTSDYVLFWDAAMGIPDAGRIAEAQLVGGDVWHAGLSMGMTGLPVFLDYLNPGWRFTRDPDPDGVATSWRLSLGACLVRTDVLRSLGGPNPGFSSLTAAALELGHRWISQGALMRYVPFLVEPTAAAQYATTPIPLVDEFRFARARFGGQWARWALWRTWRNGTAWSSALAAYRTSADLSSTYPSQHLHTLTPPELDRAVAPSVSVLIPTLDRYPHLFKVLDQLRNQTVAPLDIVVVDQTAEAEREWDWPQHFADLPLTVIWQDEAGQCSSRNAGLQVAEGETILFLDDDDEIDSDLIERHLAFLQQHQVDASCGVAEEVGAGWLPSDFTFVRDSDVFPTNNTLLRKAALEDSGLFDLAYERGARADGDLGMRLYLSGKLLVLNPAAGVLHLHAPRGGLRQHKARVVTSASSRASLMERHFLSPTEAYLLHRYFTPRQVQEAALIRTFSSLGSRGHGLRGLIRMGLMAALLPDTYARNRRYLDAGRRMLDHHPTIPALDTNKREEML